MSRRQKYDPLKNTFPLPNEIFILGLSPGELAVYSYLLCCANRKTHQCWPRYKTIGRAVGMAKNTVKKYVSYLVYKGLIHAENTTVVTKKGQKRNGNLLYTISPFQDVLESHYQQQLELLALETTRTRAQLGA